MASSKMFFVLFLLMFFRSSVYASRALLISSVGAVYINPYLEPNFVYTPYIAPASTPTASVHTSNGGWGYSHSSTSEKIPSSNSANGEGEGGGDSSLGYGFSSNNGLESSPTPASTPTTAFAHASPPVATTTIPHVQTPNRGYFYNGFNGKSQVQNSATSGGGGGDHGVIFDENNYK